MSPPSSIFFKGIEIKTEGMPQSKLDMLNELMKADNLLIQNNIPKEVLDIIHSAHLTELSVPAPEEPLGPKKANIPTPKENLSDEDSQQLEIIEKMFPEANCIIMYEEQSAIQIDFESTPVIHPDTIRNLEDRGYSKVAEFPCKCNCGAYSLIMAREF